MDIAKYDPVLLELQKLEARGRSSFPELTEKV